MELDVSSGHAYIRVGTVGMNCPAGSAIGGVERSGTSNLGSG